MTTLKQYYDLIQPGTIVRLTNPAESKVYYTGARQDIPSQYDGCEVKNFYMDDTGKVYFHLKVAEAKPVSVDDQRLWHEGALKVNESMYHFWAKVYATGSRYGIDGGRVSKLMLKRDGEIVCNYDRGWDVKPSDPDTQLAMEIILHEYNQ